MAAATPVPLDDHIGRSREEALHDLRKAGIQVDVLDTAAPGPLALLLRLGGAPAVPPGTRVRALVSGDRVIGFATADPAEASARLGQLEARVAALEGGGDRPARRPRKTEKT